MSKRKVGEVGSVRVYWIAETREYMCRIQGHPKADYFTGDLDDAIGTARLMNQAHAMMLATIKG